MNCLQSHNRGTGRGLCFVGVTCLLLTCGPALGQDADQVHWSITPYLWASNTKVDLTFRDQGLGSGDISFSDLLDVLDSAFMVNVEGGKGQWSFFGDLTYLETSNTETRTLLTIDTDSEQLIFDAAAAWWPAGVGSNLSVFGGLRYTDFDDRYTFRIEGQPIADRRNERDYTDALLGLRYRFDLSERWALLTHADYSFADSDGTWMLRANFAYTVGQRRQNRIVFGYQYKQAEFKDGDLKTEYRYYGPMAGFNFRF
jgi:hypothetical protein